MQAPAQACTQAYAGTLRRKDTFACVHACTAHTHRTDEDWSNVLVAGGAVLLSSLPLPDSWARLRAKSDVCTRARALISVHAHAFVRACACTFCYAQYYDFDFREERLLRSEGRRSPSIRRYMITRMNIRLCAHGAHVQARVRVCACALARMHAHARMRAHAHACKHAYTLRFLVHSYLKSIRWSKADVDIFFYGPYMTMCAHERVYPCLHLCLHICLQGYQRRKHKANSLHSSRKCGRVSSFKRCACCRVPTQSCIQICA